MHICQKAQFSSTHTVRPRRQQSSSIGSPASRESPRVLSREAMRREIWNFIDGPARWETSVQGPVRGGPRDHLIIPFAPGPRDVGRVAAALRRVF
jgi:hypothetical protein